MMVNWSIQTLTKLIYLSRLFIFVPIFWLDVKEIVASVCNELYVYHARNHDSVREYIFCHII